MLPSHNITGERIRIEGYAVVSEDDRIADAAGILPPALQSDAEWAFFQAGLDTAEVTVLGRQSHDVTPNLKQRRRLVLTRAAIEPSNCSVPDTIFWNPEQIDLQTILKKFGPRIGHIAVVGGQAVFDHFLAGPHRYTAFHLSRMEGVWLPGGTAVFGDVDRKGIAASCVLSAAGFVPGLRQQLDQAAHVVTWSLR